MKIPEFLKGFAKAKPTPIQIGDTCRNKETGVYSICKNVLKGIYYGKNRTTNQWEMGLIKNFEKV